MKRFVVGLAILLGGCGGDGPRVGDELIVMNKHENAGIYFDEGATFKLINVGTKLRYLGPAPEGDYRVSVLEGEYAGKPARIRPAFTQPAP